MNTELGLLGGRGDRRLEREFFMRPAATCAVDFLGKVLVHDTAAGRLAGVISDVEAYPAFVDEVHHGNKRTQRSEVMWGPAGKSYVYLIYGVWHQFAVVVNEELVPDVVFVRAATPIEGVATMQEQWDRPRPSTQLANSPGKLCRSFAITTEHYGADLRGPELILEDHGITVPEAVIRRSARVGISDRHVGHDAPLRYHIRPTDVADLLESHAKPVCRPQRGVTGRDPRRRGLR